MGSDQETRYACAKNVCNSQNYVAEFALHDYPIADAEILWRGMEARDASHNTINFCKYNLGWASIGMCTHAVYEALDHAGSRQLFGSKVIDFLLNLGELFALAVYGQLIIENARIYAIENDLLDKIFDVFVRDFARYALQLYGKSVTTRRQQLLLRRMIKRPVVDNARFGNIWREHVSALQGAY